MKIQKIILSIFFLILSSLLTSNTFAKLDLNVSPIIEEINTNTGTTVFRKAKLINTGDKTLHILTGKSDFVPNGTTGKPDFIRKSELVFPDQQLSDWISINISEFDINPGETQEIEYSIQIPADATPGGHYGAVFFKSNNSEQSAGTAVGINVDYGVLILVNVAGEVVTSIDINPPIISGGGHGSGWGAIKDDCPFGDLSRSYYDGICINSLEEIVNEITGENNTTNTGTGEDNTTNTGTGNSDDFNISFEIPIENTGNSHVKPKGKVILIDEDGNELKEVGKEIIVNDRGVIIGEKIVDYIPINDGGGNILPSSERKYQCEWQGFGYKAYDENGKEIVKYWKPGEYYTKKNIEARGFLMFWERVCERNQHKKITAIFDISYKDENGELVEYNSAEDFYIDYVEEYIGLNPYVLIPLSIFFGLILLFWLIAILKRRKCPNCKKKVDKDMKICPYCSEILTKDEEIIKKLNKKSSKKTTNSSSSRATKSKKKKTTTKATKKSEAKKKTGKKKK